jgi:small GTP-binding protein
MESDNPGYKVVMLGDAGVGKTSIVLRLIEGTFRRMTSPTIGSGTSTKDLVTPSGPVRLTIWDTAGEERYRSFTGLYSQGAIGAVIVLDVSDESSFDGLSSWVSLFREATDTGDVILVVGNKLDLDDRVITTAKAREWCDGQNFKYFEVSAKTGENVDLVFAELAEAVAAAATGQAGTVTAAPDGGQGCC